MRVYSNRLGEADANRRVKELEAKLERVKETVKDYIDMKNKSSNKSVAYASEFNLLIGKARGAEFALRLIEKEFGNAK